MKKVRSFLTAKYGLYALGVLVLIVGGWLYLGRSSNTAAQTLVMAPTSFVEQVAVSGKVVAAHDVDMGFSTGGRIAHVYVAVGDGAHQGMLLAEVENGDLRAALVQQQAKLDSLKAGSRPEDIAAAQAALTKAQQDLDNYYQSIGDTAQSAYTSANDAVRTQLSSLFSNAESDNPQLSFQSSNSQAVINAQSARVAATAALNAWQQSLNALPTVPTQAQLQSLLNDSLKYLATTRSLLSAVSSALDTAASLSSSAISADKALVVAGQTEVNTAIKNLNTISQSIASQLSTVSQAQAQLDLKKAGSTSQDIEAQQALVDQAAAQLQKTLIVAPFDGTITTVNAKVGLAAAPNDPQVSIESNGTFQIESYVPEVNIAQVAVGNMATVTLDAFGATVPFAAKVVSIDPAETVRDGVSTYRVVLQFTQPDPRIKSGMTASLDIVTNRIDNTLVVPAGAIVEVAGQSVVKVRRGDHVVEVPVVVGASGIGNVQIVSGLAAGDEVVLNP